MHAEMGFYISVICCTFLEAFAMEVEANGTTLAGFNQNASFSCSLSDSKGVAQVTWQRLVKDSLENLATYSARYGSKVMEPYVDKIIFTESSFDSTSITVQNLTLGDEACYICSFNVYPSGSTRKQTCLTIQGISRVTIEKKLNSISKTVSERNVVVTCSAIGKPANEIRWNSSEDISAFSEYQNNSRVTNADGSETITSKLTVILSRFSGEYVDCIVNGRGTSQSIIKRINLLDDLPPDQGVKSFSGEAILIVILVPFVIGCVIVTYLYFRRKGECRNLSSIGIQWVEERCRCCAVSVEGDERKRTGEQSSTGLMDTL